MQELRDHTTDYEEEKQWSFTLTAIRRCGLPLELSSLPKVISSKMSELIVSSFFKSHCPTFWKPEGTVVV